MLPIQESPSSQPDADRLAIHRRLGQLARQRAAQDLEIGTWLLRGLAARVHLSLGYGSFLEYVERLFGWGPRFATERLRVAEAMADLGETARALGAGEITWSAARELCRVATSETERDWLAAARGKTARQIEELVSGHRPGDRPGDEEAPEARRHVLRFEVSAQTLALARDALGKVRRETGGELTDDEALDMVFRKVLGGPGDAGRSPYQIRMTLCTGCGRGWQEGHGEEIAIDAAAVETAACDAQEIEAAHVGDVAAHVGGSGRPRATQTIPPAIRREVVRRDHGRCVVPGCRASAFLEVHHVDPRAEGGGHDPDSLSLLCSAHHRALHRGFLVIEGRVSTGLSFRHADGTSYGGAARAEVSVALAESFQALRQLGFKEKEARSAIEAARPHLGPEATTEAVLRRALTATWAARQAATRAQGAAPAGVGA
jgi:hypothetical protein